MSTSTPYYDQNHPFWAFVADLHEQGPAHPFFANRGDTTNGGTDEERTNPWARMRRGPMRMRGGHGPHHRRHAHFAAQQDEEMRDLTSDTEVDEKAAAPGARASQDPESDALVSGDESHHGHGHGGRRGGKFGGRGRGRGIGFRGSRGGMGGRFAHSGPTEILSDAENVQSGDELHRAPGMRRGGRFTGRGCGLGRPGVRAAGGAVEIAEPARADAENQQPDAEGMKRGPGARRAARLAGRGHAFGGSKARANREVVFDATALGQSDEENVVSGDETKQAVGPRRGPGMGGRGGGRGRGVGMMGRGRGGGLDRAGGEEFTAPGTRGRLARFGPHSAQRPDAMGFHSHGRHAHGPHAHGRHAHGRHAHGPHAHGPRGMHQRGSMVAARQTNRHADGKFRPEVDVFDHSEAYVVHVSVPGAKKKDIEVNWNAERSALSITGTINRPGDEEVLNTISTNERNVGEFKRMVRLGKKGSPAQVDVEGIKAKIEDGVLSIEVPKMESGYVEIKKVDVA